MLEIKRVFSTPAARSEFDLRICLTRDDGTKAGHESMAQSIPSVHIPLRAFVGHLSFCFGKAANAPRRGLKIECKWPTRDNTKIAFSSKIFLGKMLLLHANDLRRPFGLFWA